VSAIDDAVLAELARAREEMLDFLAAAVRLPSVTGEEGVAAPLFHDWFEANGFEAETKPVPAALRDRYPAMAHEQNLERRPNVFGWWRGEGAGGATDGGAPLVLNGHIDVVPANEPERWRHDPWGGVRADGRVWGRGSADMKGGIVAAMFAVRALRDAGARLARDVQVQCVMAEETGGLGTLAALESEPRPAAAIVLEPTDCVVAPACGGIVQFTISVEGVAAHTAVSWAGVSAMEKLWHVYTALREAVRERNERISHPLFDALPAKAPFGIGTFSAGEWRSTIPAQAEMSGRVGVMPGESIAEVRMLIEQIVARACEDDEWLREHPARVEWIHEGFPAWETPGDDPLVRAFDDGFRAVAGAGGLGAVTYGSDAGHFARAGVPTLLFGPGRIYEAHMHDEHVEERQMEQAARVVALSLLRYEGA